MNILKLAKHLREFTLDEINMIAEFDCKTELEHLLNTNKISFEQGMYKYIEETAITRDYGLFVPVNVSIQNIDFTIAANIFLNNYVKNVCKKETLHHYKTIFRMHILPYFQNKNPQSIGIDDIKNFYKSCAKRNLQPRRIKNILALLKQLLKYCEYNGLIKNTCNFQVRRLTSKNEFSMNRIIFEGE